VSLLGEKKKKKKKKKKAQSSPFRRREADDWNLSLRVSAALPLSLGVSSLSLGFSFSFSLNFSLNFSFSFSLATQLDERPILEFLRVSVQSDEDLPPSDWNSLLLLPFATPSLWAPLTLFGGRPKHSLAHKTAPKLPDRCHNLVRAGDFAADFGESKF